jgi:hypothetical protein
LVLRKLGPVVFSWPTLYAPAAADALATALIEGNPGARDIMRLAGVLPCA